MYVHSLGLGYVHHSSVVAKVYLLEGIRLSDIGTRTFRVSLANAWAEVESPILGREFERGRGNGLRSVIPLLDTEVPTDR